MDNIKMDPMQKQMLDDVFDAFQMIAGGALVSLMHAEAGVTRWSPGAVELFGLPGEYVPNGAMDWGDYVHPEDRKRYLDVMAPLAEGMLHSYDLTYRVRTKTGEYYHFRNVGSVLRNEQGKPSLIGGILINQGLTENTDVITVLPNKYAFFDDLKDLMARDGKAMVLLLGVSKLSRINENHGYSYGNRVLQEMAWLIQETVGERGKVYRMDAATFAVVSETLSREELSAIYDSIRLKLQRGIRVDGNRHNLTANGGLISIADTHSDPATIYSCLGYAYRESKQHKHGELVDFNGSVKYDVNESLEMVNVIRDCIVDGCKGFLLDYQPVVDTLTGSILGAEALVRWEGEPYGEVEPMEFLPILENDFVFEELGGWILRTAMTDGKKLLEQFPRFQLGVNISASQVEDEYFVDSVTELLSETGFPAANLSLEITKGCRLLDFDRLHGVAEQLHKQGIRVGVDDFGSGFESIGFLKRFAADYIKFDRELVRDIEIDDADRETILHLAECAAARGTTVIAKGVETAGMRDILKSCRIGSAQGNLYSKPMSIDGILKEFLS
ncbi:MAG: EAL domain-containing protein [Oscillospiraceae bacterium]|nr:EAL domain-containing protein [Oscillospiraceae bacterium]